MGWLLMNEEGTGMIDIRKISHSFWEYSILLIMITVERVQEN